MRIEEVFEGECRSEIQRQTVRFKWTVKDCSFVKTNLYSSEFPTSDLHGVGLWRLKLIPTYADNSKFNIFLQQMASKEISAHVKMSLMNSVGFVPKAKTKYPFYYNQTFQLVNFVERDKDLKETKGVLPSKEFTIVCEIVIDNWRTDHTEEWAKVECPLSQLVEDMGNLLSSESLTDVTITAGGREFRAHKAILAARSPVFAAMFRSEMVENTISVVEITDIDPDVFHEMLKYIYTGNKISFTETNELLAAADKYNVKGLKLLCERKLCKELSVKNVLENIALADLYNASDLKKKAFSFFAKNRPRVMKSSTWENFTSSHPFLLKEILENI